MSYFLNIHGPSEPIETACSSSLVAIHRAVSAMENGTCEMAIVGGVNTIVTPEFHISFNKAGMLCEDGRCKTFSDQANGYVRGEGVGMLFLKKLKAAERGGRSYLWRDSGHRREPWRPGQFLDSAQSEGPGGIAGNSVHKGGNRSQDRQLH